MRQPRRHGTPRSEGFKPGADSSNDIKIDRGVPRRIPHTWRRKRRPYLGLPLSGFSRRRTRFTHGLCILDSCGGLDTERRLAELSSRLDTGVNEGVVMTDGDLHFLSRVVEAVLRIGVITGIRLEVRVVVRATLPGHRNRDRGHGRLGRFEG